MTSTVLEQPRQILIGLTHITERSAAAIETLLRSSVQCQARITSAHEAQIILIDLDVGNPAALWSEFRKQFPTQPAIVLSLAEQHLPEVVWVKKPIKPSLLLEAIHQASKQIKQTTAAHSPVSKQISQKQAPDLPQQKHADKAKNTIKEAIKETVHAAPEKTPSTATIQISNPDNIKTSRAKTKPASQTRDVTQAMENESNHNTFGIHPDFDPQSSRIPAHVFYDPQLTLQGLLHDTLQAAKVDGKARTIEGVLATILLIPGVPYWVKTQLSPQRVRAISAVQLANMLDTKVRILNEHESQPSLPKIPFENFFWLVALSTARGRVPLGTNLHTPVSLKQWPNFTRLETIPHAMRISALWLQQPMGLLETATQLSIPQRYVFAFYSAAHAIGIASITPATTPKGTQSHAQTTNNSTQPITNPSDTPKERKSFLGKLLNRLLHD